MEHLSSPSKNAKFIRFGTAAMLILLVAQFVAGMYLNFFTELPDVHPGTDGSYAPSVPWALAGNAGVALAIHVLLWIVLTLSAVILVICSIVSKRRAYIAGNSLGFLCLLGAGSGGLNFLNAGGSDVESFIMAIGFILAFTVYGATLYKTKTA